MKVRFLAVVTAALVGMLLIGSVAQAGGPTPGANDHTWNVAFAPGTAGASHPNTTVVLTLGKSSTAETAPYSTPFFTIASTTYAGLTPSGSGVANLGVKVGTIGFNIEAQTSALKTTGQPQACGDRANGSVNVIASPFNIYAAAKSPPASAGHGPGAAAGFTSTDADGGSGGGVPQTYGQEPDKDLGGAPFEVRLVPDWYQKVIIDSGLVGFVSSRAFGIAKTASAATSVNFITLSLGPVSENVTVLSNPVAAFSPLSQNSSTCPGFASTVSTLGTSVFDGTVGDGTHSWACTQTEFGLAPPAGCTPYVATNFNTTTTGADGTYAYAIGLAGAPDPTAACTTANCPPPVGSGPATIGNGSVGDNMYLFTTWSKCKAGPNDPAQVDANANGIGDVCQGGGGWTNSNATAIANAALPACTGVIPTSPPFLTCQDADQDGSLNALDNCPLVANTDSPLTVPANVTPGDNQLDSDGDGIGNACDAEPYIKGDGTGWANGMVSFPTTGKYVQFGDYCNDPFTITASTAASANGAANGPCVDPVDSNVDGTPDFVETGGGNACVQDHSGDSNHDGYSDGDQTTPASTSCTGFPGVGLAQDSLKKCPGRYWSGDTSIDSPPDSVLKARSDVDLDGQITIVDLSITAGQFLNLALLPADPNNEMDVDKDHQITIVDLSIMAGFFLDPVPAC